MIAADTSALISFFAGSDGPGAARVQATLAANNICVPAVVVTEMLSSPTAQAQMALTVADFPRLEILDGFWERAGENRRLLRQKGLKASLGDALIAQSCIDHDVALITEDSDFRHFEKYCGLKLA